MNPMDWLIIAVGASALLVACVLSWQELAHRDDRGMAKAVRTGNQAILDHVKLIGRMKLTLWVLALICLGFIGTAAWHIARAL